MARVEVGTLFGGLDVIVPDGIRATPSAILAFGDTDCDLACTGPGPGPEVVVDATGRPARAPDRAHPQSGGNVINLAERLRNAG